MGKRKSKKIAAMTRLLLFSFITILFLGININLFFASYKLLMLSSLSISSITLIISFSIIFGSLIGYLLSINYKWTKKAYIKTKGLLISIPIIAILLFTLSLGYKSYKIKNISEKLETELENYEYLIDFDIQSERLYYKIDPISKNVYYIKNNELIEVKPRKIENFQKDYKFETYKIDKGYVIINDNKTYFSKSFKKDMVLYHIEIPIDHIKRNYKMTEYYRLESPEFQIINDLYKGEQYFERMFLFMKYNDIFYTKERLYDIRIPIRNNFENYYEADYKKAYVKIKIDNNDYKINFMFDEKLELVFNKDLMEIE